MHKYESQNSTKNIIAFIMLIIASIILFYPVYYLIFNSLRNLYSSPAIIFPKGINFTNYKWAITLIPFGTYLKNTLIFLGITLPLQIVNNTMMGYAFARLQAPGKKTIFTICLATLMIPGIAITLPQYVYFSKALNLHDTFLLVLIMNMGFSAFNVFFVRQYFSTIPKALEDSAKIDGCSYIGLIFKIFMPLSLPAIALITFFIFGSVWGDYFTPFMYFSEKHYPLATALFGAQYTFPDNPSMPLQPVVLAASVLFALPIVIVFLATQKYLVDGIVTSGMKG